ncbi:hypothetical protein, partial [Salmonella enterica]|uniref:hypothetical protein n=1 Tax=Salmonella enterica TaxID=28901 RepID=UPI003FD89029
SPATEWWKPAEQYRTGLASFIFSRCVMMKHPRQSRMYWSNLYLFDIPPERRGLSRTWSAC